MPILSAVMNADIKKYCSIASCVKLGGAKHPIEWVGTSPVFYVGRDSVSKKYSEYDREKTKRINVGNDVWIGIGAIIKSGVIIGDGAVSGDDLHGGIGTGVDEITGFRERGRSF